MRCDFKVYDGIVGVDLGGWVEQLPKNIARSLFPSLRREHKKTSVPLPENWAEIRQVVIERDKYCRICGGRGQGVHHIDEDRTHNDFSNLVYLCWPCHQAIHNRKLQLVATN